LPIVDDLLRNAYQDTQLLIKNDQLGDVLSTPRDVEFLLRAPDEQKALTVCSFITDNQYGTAEVQEDQGSFSVLVIIHMPITQNLICSVSALMSCLAAIFGMEYDGWGSVVKRAA
jgi:regulator of RNase E activity RraB